LVEKKFSGSTVPSAAVGKACADGFYVFADGFERSAKDLFPVVMCMELYFLSSIDLIVWMDMIRPTV
jgi:hypothetical protein